MADHSHGVPPQELADDDLRREVEHLHETRQDAMLTASEAAWQTHTERMLALENEYLRRFPGSAAPAPDRTRAGRRREAGQV
jgi:uncharacterized protein DUF6158